MISAQKNGKEENGENNIWKNWTTICRHGNRNWKIFKILYDLKHKVYFCNFVFYFYFFYLLSFIHLIHSSFYQFIYSFLYRTRSELRKKFKKGIWKKVEKYKTNDCKGNSIISKPKKGNRVKFFKHWNYIFNFRICWCCKNIYYREQVLFRLLIFLDKVVFQKQFHTTYSYINVSNFVSLKFLFVVRKKVRDKFHVLITRRTIYSFCDVIITI